MKRYHLDQDEREMEQVVLIDIAMEEIPMGWHLSI